MGMGIGQGLGRIGVGVGRVGRVGGDLGFARARHLNER